MKKDPKYIFCATATTRDIQVLHLIFSMCNNTYSGIQPSPKMNGKSVALYNNYKYREVRDIFITQKLPAIEALSKGFDKYVDLNHMFIKSFAEIACEILKDNMAIIHLVNNLVDSSIFLYRTGNKWILDPEYPANKTSSEFLQYREFRHSFFRAIWHNLECYVRSKNLISRYRNMKHYVFFSKWLGNEFEIISLIESLKISIKPQRIKAVSSIYHSDEMANLRKFNNTIKAISREKAFRITERFVDRFGERFLLSEEECKQLMEI